ncbi:MAG TPA: NFACT RNA binding domain-containing protein [Tissierellales bacterium]|nr:NFACT RNA binding domain-containing protein [Tissierellales bacterium]
MAFDGIVTKALVSELNEKIVGGKINKIYQQEKDEILLHIYNKGENFKLIISASSNNSRFYLTKSSKENPQSPPMFCMLLRKYIQGGVISRIEQFSLDRVVFIDIDSYDEIGQLSTKRLIIEIMGRHSNIILLDKEIDKIYDSIKRIPETISRVRQILPGLNYENPPIGDKISPLTVDSSTFLKLLNNTKENLPIFKFFYTSFLGLSPLISREICFKGQINPKKTIKDLSEKEKRKLFYSFNDLMEEVKNLNFRPNLIFENSNYIAFHALELNQYERYTKESFNSISQVLDKYYKEKDIHDRINQKSHSIRKTLQIQIERSTNKLAKRKAKIEKAKNRDDLKIYGDLISANIYKIKKGEKSVELENFYDENLQKIKIPLDPKLSPAENAQKYYKSYTKLKNAHKLLKKQIPETKNEIHYLENVLMSIDNCTNIDELNEIKAELMEEGYIRKNYKKNKPKKTKHPKPEHFLSSDGFHIYVGKNNKQNDYLTLRLSHKEDLWLHVKDIPGSHVVIRNINKEFSDIALKEAAMLAGYYSKGRNSQNLPVDYTKIKYVNKPKGAKPGMIIYENNKTIYVTPKKEYITNIKKVEN